MTWNGSTTPTKERIFGSLPYILPLVVAFPFGIGLIKLLPFLAFIYLPLQPFLQIYYGVPLAGLAVFFVLLFAVVRNQNISNFIRFNTMQAILIDIALVLCNMVYSVFVPALGSHLVAESTANLIFIATLGACIYSVVQCLRGQYAEIPGISEAVESQIR
jgi:uncharacterized membrane protein